MAKTAVTNITDAKFIDAHGKFVQVKDVVKQEDCWYLDKERKYVLSHKAVQSIAKAAGISKNFVVEESSIMPDYKNGMEHIVRVTIKCNATKEGVPGCVHDSEDTLTVTGEANRENTSNRGKGYLRKMAEKRAYDIAVLQHLGLDSTIFSEEESETFVREPIVKEQSINIMNTDIEHVKDYINGLLRSKTEEELTAAMQAATQSAVDGDVTASQLAFLKNVFEKQKALIDSKKK